MLLDNTAEYTQEVEILEAWCKVNNLSIKTEKAREITVDSRMSSTTLLQLLRWSLL